MKQTPINEIHNQEVLSLIPISSTNIIEIGSSSGVLAKEFKKYSPAAYWHGVEIDSDYAMLSSRYCDATTVGNVEDFDELFFEKHSKCDCWIFSDVLEHLKDPYSVLSKIRRVIPKNGSIVACIPNAQNWSVISRLAIGDFRYSDSGLLDRTHLRWFTRQTIYELFENQGFVITNAISRTFHEPDPEILNCIGKIAMRCGFDSQVAVSDSIPFQYIVLAKPV